MPEQCVRPENRPGPLAPETPVPHLAQPLPTAHGPLFGDGRENHRLITGPGPRCIENDDFPFERLSEVAEVESWRKEINRPVYHIHKWWAQRLGSVFRAIVLATFAPEGSDLLSLFYDQVRIPDAVVFDPFMGSGTTLGESLKLGAKAIGRDINPVANLLVRNALALHDRRAIERTFKEIERDVADRIRHYYRTRLANGENAEVLYYFWVKQIDCPACKAAVDLFPSYIFARHAYVKKFPQAQAVCPTCSEINSVRYDATSAICVTCRAEFNPQRGTAQGQFATCPNCSHRFSIARAVKATERPPDHRMYAKLVLLGDGRKMYVPATDEDRELYAAAVQQLGELHRPYPMVGIQPGYNTNQALGYNYRRWHEMFNERQLLCLSILAGRIRQIEDATVRELFVCLFSGTLEFNNMFASYKGEGTGAVRHMFAHHILKPERMPLEANLWGTSKSSGAFSTIFKNRICRALDSAADPFELRLENERGRKVTKKVFGLSEPLGHAIAPSYADMVRNGNRVYLSCGDSSRTDLPNQSVDAVITDPPFFDNVHYSELADFFHVWQQYILDADALMDGQCTTRSTAEVQNGELATFTARLTNVFTEARRVLKNDGLLVFTYHHSRHDGWKAVLEALIQSGFHLTASQPIKAEMSVAMPKAQAKEPIDLDIIMVCRKRQDLMPPTQNGDLWGEVIPAARTQISRFRQVGRKLSQNDIRIIIMGQLLRHLSSAPHQALGLLDSNMVEIEAWIERLG